MPLEYCHGTVMNGGDGSTPWFGGKYTCPARRHRSSTRTQDDANEGWWLDTKINSSTGVKTQDVVRRPVLVDAGESAKHHIVGTRSSAHEPWPAISPA